MSDDLKDLMLGYSRRGMEDWRKKADEELRRSAGECLSNAIVEDEWEVGQAIDGLPKQRKFIPIPKHGYKGFEWGFFLPNRDRNNGDLKSLILFLLVDQEKKRCLAFRFEGDSTGPHGYSHVQMTWDFKKLHLPNQIGSRKRTPPDWLPENYPAFPVPAKSWIGMFLAMTTSVHGRHGGIDALIREIFRDNARRYQRMLDETLFQLQLDSDS